MKKIKNGLLCVIATGMIFSALGSFNIARAEEKKENVITSKDQEDIYTGKIRLKNGMVDSILFKNNVLVDNISDNDNDGIKDKDELIIKEENGKKYLEYKSHPLIPDSDGDGIIDKDDKEPLKWNISRRDMAMFQKMAYYDEDYIDKLFNENTNENEIKNNYDKTIHTELSKFWEIKKKPQTNKGKYNFGEKGREIYHLSSGLDGYLFTTKKVYPFLDGEEVNVLVLRGTEGYKDYFTDALLYLGAWNPQASDATLLIQYLKDNDVKNLYIVGHSLGGYLAQIAASEARKIGYTGFQQSYTFNAPMISRPEEYRKLSDQLTIEGKSTHFVVNNDIVSVLAGSFDRHILVANTINKHSSISYFEPHLSNYFDLYYRCGFNGGFLHHRMKELKFFNPS
ncbi:Mbeg1-like protein [Helcococcus ovis]|uniref:DUF2974 domain-containing protein n=2 Tax=Helcococcus ovis TaxID=72026 RepID=A0A4R9C1Z9_9FIRM|nr:Mbeg1-like protein [Helcococcus ovis]TFF65204.1 DUF2974 domain-containing protein [Helcococcus ovis]TFF65761.1 DUF2974 domain-containing protein [Helcococcus ovis]TFF68527.1 DUF2974 domain-containing protein [Helcococcus ovis]WNZ01414.1 DUF2974 domain-containing protein [Helcococcus ovis]